jgi:hypothetical protein
VSAYDTHMISVNAQNERVWLLRKQRMTRSLRLTWREDAGIKAASLPRLLHVVLAWAGRVRSGKSDGGWRWGAG